MRSVTISNISEVCLSGVSYQLCVFLCTTVEMVVFESSTLEFQIKRPTLLSEFEILVKLLKFRQWLNVLSW